MTHRVLKLAAIAAVLFMAGAVYAPAQSPNEDAKAKSGCGFDKPCPEPPPVLAHPAAKPSMVGKPAADWHPTPKISKPLDKGTVPPPAVSRANTTTSNCVATAREFETPVERLIADARAWARLRKPPFIASVPRRRQRLPANSANLRTLSQL